MNKNWEIERFKIGFQYVLMIAASLVMGWLLPSFAGNSVTQNHIKILEQHFSLPFASLSSHTDIAAYILGFSLPTLLCVAAIFVFSFSSLVCLVSDGTLIFLGMRTGYTTSLLFFVLRNSATDTAIGWGHFLLVLLFRSILLIVITFYAFRATEYSYRMRRYTAIGRASPQPATVLLLLGYTLLISLLLFALHAAYCGLIYVL